MDVILKKKITRGKNNSYFFMSSWNIMPNFWILLRGNNLYLEWLNQISLGGDMFLKVIRDRGGLTINASMWEELDSRELTRNGRGSAFKEIIVKLEDRFLPNRYKPWKWMLSLMYRRVEKGNFSPHRSTNTECQRWVEFCLMVTLQNLGVFEE